MSSLQINEDARFASLASRLISSIREAQDVTLAAEVAKVASEMTGRGIIQSSPHAQCAGRAATNDLEVRAKLTWASLVRVHQTIGSPLYPDLPSHLKIYFREAMDSHLQAVLPIASRHQGRDTYRSITELQVRNGIARTIRAHDVEIDVYVESLRTRVASTSSADPNMAATYNFYGDVGAVQTGPNAIANIESLSPDSRAQLVGALESLKEAFRAAPETASRTDLEEIVDDASTALSAERKNLTKLNALLFALSEAAQGIASVRPAYDALKAMFATAGVFLP